MKSVRLINENSFGRVLRLIWISKVIFVIFWLLNSHGKEKIKAKIYSLFNFSKNIVIKIIVNITQGVAKSRDKKMAPVFLRLETL